MKYDDHELSCPTCSLGLDADALCDCDTDPKCIRCHRIYDVELRRWGTPGWMGGAA